MAAAKDQKQLKRLHQALLQSLKQGAEADDAALQQVQQAAQAMVSLSLQNTLSQIPVEEINREKRGFRVSALRSSGYETIGDLQNASLSSLAAVDGISDTGAYEIQAMAKDIAEKARQGIKIRLSGDNRTPEATLLLKSLWCYEQQKPLGDQCDRLYYENHAGITYAIRLLDAAGGGFKRLFASKEQKAQADQALEFLRQSQESGFGAQARDLLSQLDGVAQISDSQIWDAFSQNPHGFFHTLEQLCPGLLGNDDSRYGLPQALAQEISQETPNLQGLSCQLRRYQEWGVKYILHQQQVLLGDEMGLGKTVQAIACMVAMRNQGGTHFLVVCPASVIENWCREIRKHSDLTPVKIHGTHREAALSQWMAQGGVAVTNFETTKILNFPADFQFSMMIVDEAHYIKNPQAHRTQHVKEISAHADRRLFMTGTALENRVEEMVNLLSMLRPDIASEAGKMAALSSAPQFQEVIAPVYYRRKRETVLTELPELMDTPEWCEMTPQEETVYENAVVAGKYTEARRVSWNAPSLSQSSKAARMLEIIEDAREEGRKVIVFSFFLDTLSKVQSLLGDRCLQTINGSVPVSRRQEIVDEFNAAPAGTVLTAQIQAGGTGLNIQAASVVILCEPQFKPSIENQAISRAYRMGQTRNVLVYRLLCEDSVDELIMQMLESKQAEFDAFANESAAAEETLALDQDSFHNMMQEEKDRILAKQAGLSLPEAQKTEEEIHAASI